ncbi:adhesion G-protein coupled receptor V1-like [Dysidea avara]|uniref:adhesion G-protein coupled receptor V1-like n=1 Tax=Dysidea avara TaxID=196820 RepID=UPI003318FBDE
MSLMLDREPGVQFNVSIYATNINTTGYDYSITPTLVTFGVNEMMQSINIAATADMLLEYNENFQLSFELTASAQEIGVITGSASTTTITILNNDSVVVKFQTVQYCVDEGSVVSITVLADKPIYNNYSVLLTTFINSSLHAASDEDFNSVTFEVVFAPNQTMADLLITAHKDVLLEQNETFFVRLELSEGIDMIGVKIAEENNIASVTIINNNVVKIGLTSAEYFTIEDSTVMKVILTLEDNQPANTSFTISLHLTPRSASDVDFRDDDIDVTFGPRDTQVVVNISIAADEYPEQNETFAISLFIPTMSREIGVGDGRITNAVGHILNDDSLYVSIHSPLLNVDEGNTATIQVTLDHAAGRNISVGIIAQPLTATDSDFALLQSVINFGPTDTSQTISVLAIDDDILEYIETFTIGIVIADDLSEIGVLPGENNITSVNIRDNDRVTATLSISDSSVNEGDKYTITVSLNQTAYAKIGFLIGTTAMTATDDDFEGGAFEVYFESTETSRNFTLTTMQDEIFEPNENFVVFLQVLSEYQKLGVYIDSANNEAIITIVNDDGKIQVSYHL